ncbi:hypothetical protein FIBSPDRAFT_602725 [Athelia psychrophila]|uniref:Uncharacterized protein n=1 Tax=Athelia psychrophila TaxID=1759441 RepID=A0A166GPW3_9AGAM|nr:hypothetical protein FIBSPDRAFT_602725 [Fibularhizoctonia sp. CBS 109695]
MYVLQTRTSSESVASQSLIRQARAPNYCSIQYCTRSSSRQPLPIQCSRRCIVGLLHVPYACAIDTANLRLSLASATVARFVSRTPSSGHSSACITQLHARLIANYFSIQYSLLATPAIDTANLRLSLVSATVARFVPHARPHLDIRVRVSLHGLSLSLSLPNSECSILNTQYSILSLRVYLRLDSHEIETG